MATTQSGVSLLRCIDIAAELPDHMQPGHDVSEQMDNEDTAIPDDLHVQLLQDLQNQQPPEFNEGWQPSDY